MLLTPMLVPFKIFVALSWSELPEFAWRSRGYLRYIYICMWLRRTDLDAGSQGGAFTSWKDVFAMSSTAKACSFASLEV